MCLVPCALCLVHCALCFVLCALFFVPCLPFMVAREEGRRELVALPWEFRPRPDAAEAMTGQAAIADLSPPDFHLRALPRAHRPPKRRGLLLGIPRLGPAAQPWAGMRNPVGVQAPPSALPPFRPSALPPFRPSALPPFRPSALHPSSFILHPSSFILPPYSFRTRTDRLFPIGRKLRR